ncbi:MAG: nucleoside deaminase [Bacteroidia bacterium]|nr:nucleoside deaminase [Bacteroidia bacterium]
MLNPFDDEHFMRRALAEAEYAFEKGEVPIGAVVVANNRVIGRGHNQVEMLHDATAHAEMLALTAASEFLNSKYLTECTLYVTIEPCPMCAGALRWAQLGRVVYGAHEPKHGYSRFGGEMFHPKTEIMGGILAEEAAALMKSFFQNKRK